MGKSTTLERPVATQQVEAVEPTNGKVHRPGDKCNLKLGAKPCPGVLGVTSTFVQGDGTRIRYIQCNVCHLPRPQYKQTLPSRYGASKRKQ